MMKRDFWKNRRFRKITASLFLLAVFLCFSFLGSGADIVYRYGGESKGEARPEETVTAEDGTESKGGISAKDKNAADEGESGSKAGGEEAAKMIFVDISGCVARPGVYQLSEGSRLFEVIDLAGGLTEDADVRSVNRAKTLIDEEVIVVLSREEYEKRGESLGGEGRGSGTGTGGGYVEGKVDLNSAGAEALESLSGIGPAMAQRILEYRESHGRFRRIEDLMNVSGIGEKTFAKLKEHICVQ